MADSSIKPTENKDLDPISVPLDSHLRTTPIHPDLPDFKVGPTDPASSSADSSSIPISQYNPITNAPWTSAELQTLDFKSLLAQYPNAESAAQAQEEAVKELKAHLDDNEKKKKEVERDMQEAAGVRAVERRIYEKMKSSKGKD